jgi:sulfur carrier protein ThiS
MPRKNSRKGNTPKKQGLVEVTVTPTQGSATVKSVDVASCATVEGALKALGISPDRKDLLLNGKPVKDMKSALKPGDKLSVAERPQGS